MSKLKILLRGIRTNLFSFCLVFFSTLLVVVVLVVNFSFEQSVVSTRIEQLKEMFHNTQIYISIPERAAGQDAGGGTGTADDQNGGVSAAQGTQGDGRFEIAQIKSVLTGDSNVSAWVEGYYFTAETKMKTSRVSLDCIDLVQQKKVYQIGLSEGSVDFTEENGVIVSETFAKDNSLKLNDTFTVYLALTEEDEAGEGASEGESLGEDASGEERTEEDGAGGNSQEDGSQDEDVQGREADAAEASEASVPDSFDVVIKGISPDSGLFQMDQSLIIGKLAFAQKTFNQPGKINGVDVALHDVALITETSDALNTALGKLSLKLAAEQKFDEDYYDSYVSTVVLALNLFVGFMVLVSVYIILSVFRSYVYQNMREMMTLRSIGFSIKHYRRLVLGQVGVITLSASLLAVLLSYPCVSLLMSVFMGDSSQTALNVPAALVIVVCVCAVSLLSALLATIKVTKTPIVDILKKNLVQRKDSHRNVFFSLGLFLWSMAVALLFFGDVLGVGGYFAAVGLALVGFIFLHEFLVYGFSRFMEKVFGKRGGSLGLFARQLKFNCGSYTQSISIISLVLVVSTLAASISYVLDEALSGVYQGSDLVVGVYSEEYDQAVTALNSAQGAPYVMQKRRYVEIDKKWVEIAGVPVETYMNKNYERVVSGNRQEIFGRLNGKETIIITTTFAKTHNKKIGDSVKVDTKDFLVVGIVNSFENMGNVLFVSERNFNETFKEYDYCLALVDTNTEEATREFLNGELEKNKVKSFSVASVGEMYEEQAQDNQLIINVIYFLCVFSLLISGISMISNLIINMVSRKLDFLIYRTIGITRTAIRRTALYEALSMGLYSGLTGIAVGCVLMPVLSIILSYYIGSIGYSVHLGVMGLLVGVACLISVLSVLFTIQRFVFKTNLIEEIKRV